MARKDLDIVIGARDEATAKLKSVGGSLDAIQGRILAIAGAWLSWQGVTKLFEATVTAAAKEEEMLKRLETAVELTGIKYRDAKYEIDTFIAGMQDTTRFGDSDMIPVIQEITQLTGDMGKGLEGAKLAADMASSGLFDLDSAARYVAMAMSGNVEMLGRYIPQLKDSAGLITKNMDATQKWAVAKDILNQKFAGAAQKDLDTYAGQLNRFNNYLEDMGEAIGVKVLPYLTEMASRWVEFLDLVGLIQRPLRVTTDNLDDQQSALKAVQEEMDIVNTHILANDELLQQGARSQKDWLDKSIEYSDQLNNLEGQYKTIKDAIDSYLASLKDTSKGENDFNEILLRQLDLRKSNLNWMTLQAEMIKRTSELKLELIQAETSGEEAFTAFYDDQHQQRLAAVERFLGMELGSWANTSRARVMIAYAAFASISTAHQRLTDDIVEQMWGARSNFREIFKEMAKDFIKYMIAEITKALIAAVARWVVMMIFFDNPRNDAMAIQMGRDYARFFQQGVWETLNLNDMAGGMARSVSPMPVTPSLRAPSLSGSVTVIVQGNIIGEDRWVKNNLIPVIEGAVRTKESRLLVD